MKVFLQSIQSKLVTLIILALLPGLIIFILYSFHDRNTAIESALEKALITANAITSDQSKIINETEIFLRNLSVSPAVLKPRSSQCSAFLAEVLNLSDRYINLGVPLVNGDLICNAMPLTKPVNVIDRPDIQQALRTKAFSTGEYQTNRAAGVSSINFAYPVIHPGSDSLLGFVVAVVSLNRFSTLLSESHLSKNTVAYITDYNKNIIAKFPVNTHELSKFSEGDFDSIVADDFAISESFKILKSSDNLTRVFVSRLITSGNKHAPLTLSIGIPFNEELTQIDTRFVAILVLLLFFSLLIIITASYGFRRSISTPIAALVKSAKSIASGESNTPFPQHSIFELVTLQEQFSALAKTRLDAEEKLKEQQLKDIKFKENQNLLFESQYKLTKHIENTPLGYIFWDTNFYCREWNKSAENIFGFSSEEAIGRHVTELILTPHAYHDLKDLLLSLFL